MSALAQSPRLLARRAVILGSVVLLSFVAPVVGRAAASSETATFAGGCFWCMEPPFEKLDGVSSVTAGFTGGTLVDPSYEDVSAGGTGHVESVQIVFDPKRVTYKELLDVYWRNIDPTMRNGQFCDRGAQYRSAIFTHSAEQQKLAEASREALRRSGKLKAPIVTEIAPATTFYAAEDYHQDYHRRNPVRYRYYRFNCGRDARLEELWGPPVE